MHRLTAADLAAPGLPPLGPALGAFEMRILDEDDRDVAPGEVGEVVLSGPQLVRGYLPADHPASRAFVSLDGVATYRTGDFGKCDTAGGLTFLGRIDRQVKWNGNRIELDEIERAAYRTKGVQKAACIPVKEDNRVVDILLLVQPETDATLTTQVAAAVLLAALPATMVPRDIRIVTSLPVTVNGKLDSKALLKAHLAPLAEPT